MAHVKGGSTALKSRRQTALERLEKHLGDHRSFHKDNGANKYSLDDGKFKSHDEKQRNELSILKERVV